MSSTTFPHYADPRLDALAPSLAMVTFDMPYSVSGVTERYYHGTGLVVDAERGLVVVDRNTVPVAVGDVTVTFAGTVQVPGRVVYVHPLHNYAVVAYDPRLIGTTPVKSAKLDAARAGSRASTCGWSGSAPTARCTRAITEIASIEPLQLPLSRTMHFRDSNLETVQLVNPPLEFDGVLADKAGRVLGTWSSFAYENGRELAQDTRGVPIDMVADMLERVRTGRAAAFARGGARRAVARQRARARFAGGAGPGASRRIPRRAARCSPSCVWWAARRRAEAAAAGGSAARDRRPGR